MQPELQRCENTLGFFPVESVNSLDFFNICWVVRGEAKNKKKIPKEAQK